MLSRQFVKDGPNYPSRGYHTVTPSDTVDLPWGPTEGIYVGGAGDVAVVRIDNEVVLFAGVAAGTTLKIVAKRINNTNTDATAIVALY